MRATVEGTASGGFISAPADPGLLMALAHEMAPLQPSRPEAFEEMALTGASIHQVQTSVGTKAALLLELAGIKAAMRTWFEKDPDQVLRESAAYSARLTEVWTELRLLEQGNRDFAQLRTMQVGPVLDEIDRQFKVSQSRIAMQRQDLDMMLRGGGA
jgi:hypothetical protein